MEIVLNHTPTSDALVKEIRHSIGKYLSGHRLNHTFFVEIEALSIAEKLFLRYNIDVSYMNDISAAALLHDLTKQMDFDAQKKLCKKYGINSDMQKALLHSVTSAYLARELFNINDTVFSAIINHTTGNENMSLFDKIIFIADYTEPSRKYEHCKQTRAFLHENLEKDGVDGGINALDSAILKSLDGTLINLVSQGLPIDTKTILTRNAFIKKLS